MLLKSRYADSFPSVEEIKKVYHYLGNYHQLAYGAGEGLTFGFDLADFSKRFDIGVMKAMAVLKFLAHDGYLVLSENIFLPSRLLFLVSNEDVYRFQIENAGYDALIKAILRSYGGGFEQYISIDEAEIAGKVHVSYKDVVRMIGNLQDQGLLSYLPKSDQPQLQYLRPRLDFNHVDIDVKYIKQRKQLQMEQINAVLGYIEKKECRSIQLLSYFDEPGSEKCGLCDVCLDEKKAVDAEELEDKIDFEIAMLLQVETHGLDSLVNAITTGTEQERLARIRTLMDAGKIKTDGKNYYL